MFVKEAVSENPYLRENKWFLRLLRKLSLEEHVYRNYLCKLCYSLRSKSKVSNFTVGGIETTEINLVKGGRCLSLPEQLV